MENLISDHVVMIASSTMCPNFADDSPVDYTTSYTSDESEDGTKSMSSTTLTASSPPIYPDICDDAAVDYSMEYVDGECGASASSSSIPSTSSGIPAYCKVTIGNGEVKYLHRFRQEFTATNINSESDESTLSSSSSSSCSRLPASKKFKLASLDYRRIYRKKTEKQRTNDLLVRYLKCEVCYERLRPPLVSCEDGHKICPCCKEQWLVNCPLCGSHWNYVSPILRTLYVFTKFPCKFTANGCNVMEKGMELTFHEKSCQFKED